MEKPKRKTARVICDSYVHIPKPATITQEHWDIWLNYNSGLNTIECAMVSKMQPHEITKIISGIVERLKNKSKIAEDWSEDFDYFVKFNSTPSRDAMTMATTALRIYFDVP